jgi:hypothetical protein
MCGDRGDLVLAWLAKIVLVLGILAVIGIDTVTSVQGQVTAKDQAGTAATAGYDNYATTHNVQDAYQAALAAAKASNPADTITPQDFVVSPTGVVTLTLTRPIHTLLAHYLPIQSAKVATGTGTGTADTNP